MSNHHLPSESKLKVVFFINLGFTILEIVGGFYVNSVAIISDAVHDLGDTLAIGSAWFLDRKSAEPADKKFTYGYARLSLLGALVNGLVLILGSVFVISHAIERIISPEETDAVGMFYFAILGILVNGYAAFKLIGGKSLNERMVSWHLLEDVMGWVAVLVVSIVLQFKNWPYLDPALSLVISGVMVWNVTKSLYKAIYILLQGVPNGFPLDAIKQELVQYPFVDSLHNTRVWSTDGVELVFTTHLKLSHEVSESKLLAIRKLINKVVENYAIKEYTVQIELPNEICGAH